MFQRNGLAGLFAVLLGLLFNNAARADEIFVSNFGNNTIGEYTTAGATVNPALISGLSFPNGIAVSGSDLFIANDGNNTIGEYTTVLPALPRWPRAPCWAESAASWRRREFNLARKA